ncbi:MAG TPA: 4-(cytidine 5'-diphospho)-2-C-methyl-D-erythritol kinase [Pseudolabrys sp.]|nr:4-(cytidine 5'-diphospho)-2-C-methyl-D-erythritol kinase [Pseudolabrys sp.]
MAVVEASLADSALAKINLSLRVVGRRADGYHELESLVVFADVGDGLVLRTGGPLALEIDGTYAAACGALADNLVLKAAAAFAARVPGLRLGRFVLTKQLPVAAGIGGGSADAAAALRLMVHANRQIFAQVDFADPRVREIALGVGADVPVCLESRARIMRGVGEQLLAPLALPPLPALLVNPGVPLATRDVFAGLAGKFSKPSSAEVPGDVAAMIDWLRQHGNDLTEPAIVCAPVVAEVLNALRALSGVRLARMSGSGPTCFALFASAEDAARAGRTLQAAHKDWWIQTTTLR